MIARSPPLRQRLCSKRTAGDFVPFHLSLHPFRDWLMAEKTSPDAPPSCAVLPMQNRQLMALHRLPVYVCSFCKHKQPHTVAHGCYGY